MASFLVVLSSHPASFSVFKRTDEDSDKMATVMNTTLSWKLESSDLYSAIWWPWPSSVTSEGSHLDLQYFDYKQKENRRGGFAVAPNANSPSPSPQLVVELRKSVCFWQRLDALLTINLIKSSLILNTSSSSSELGGTVTRLRLQIWMWHITTHNKPAQMPPPPVYKRCYGKTRIIDICYLFRGGGWGLL